MSDSDAAIMPIIVLAIVLLLFIVSGSARRLLTVKKVVTGKVLRTFEYEKTVGSYSSANLDLMTVSDGDGAEVDLGDFGRHELEFDHSKLAVHKGDQVEVQLYLYRFTDSLESLSITKRLSARPLGG